MEIIILDKVKEFIHYYQGDNFDLSYILKYIFTYDACKIFAYCYKMNILQKYYSPNYYIDYIIYYDCRSILKYLSESDFDFSAIDFTRMYDSYICHIYSKKTYIMLIKILQRKNIDIGDICKKIFLKNISETPDEEFLDIIWNEDIIDYDFYRSCDTFIHCNISILKKYMDKFGDIPQITYFDLLQIITNKQYDKIIMLVEYGMDIRIYDDIIIQYSILRNSDDLYFIKKIIEDYNAYVPRCEYCMQANISTQLFIYLFNYGFRPERITFDMLYHINSETDGDICQYFIDNNNDEFILFSIGCKIVDMYIIESTIHAMCLDKRNTYKIILESILENKVDVIEFIAKYIFDNKLRYSWSDTCILFNYTCKYSTIDIIKVFIKYEINIYPAQIYCKYYDKDMSYDIYFNVKADDLFHYTIGYNQCGIISAIESKTIDIEKFTYLCDTTLSKYIENGYNNSIYTTAIKTNNSDVINLLLDNGITAI